MSKHPSIKMKLNDKSKLNKNYISFNVLAPKRALPSDLPKKVEHSIADNLKLIPTPLPLASVNRRSQAHQTADESQVQCELEANHMGVKTYKRR